MAVPSDSPAGGRKMTSSVRMDPTNTTVEMIWAARIVVIRRSAAKRTPM
jgi:hypothetical protein